MAGGQHSDGEGLRHPILFRTTLRRVSPNETSLFRFRLAVSVGAASMPSTLREFDLLWPDEEGVVATEFDEPGAWDPDDRFLRFSRVNRRD